MAPSALTQGHQIQIAYEGMQGRFLINTMNLYSHFESLLVKWFSNLLLTADSTEALGTLRDMKNMRYELVISV